MSDSTDSILRQFLMLKSADLGDELQMLPDGKFRITSPSVWQTIHEQFLQSLEITKVWSVVRVSSADYGQDSPSQQRLQIDLDAVDRGVMLHRLIIMADHLWPSSVPLPQEPLRSWIESQHDQGIWIGLIRESQLPLESILLAEFGIFGDRAIAERESDDEPQQFRLRLAFDADHIQQAKTRWKTLKPYAVSYMTLLDQLESKE